MHVCKHASRYRLYCGAHSSASVQYKFNFKTHVHALRPLIVVGKVPVRDRSWKFSELQVTVLKDTSADTMPGFEERAVQVVVTHDAVTYVTDDRPPMLEGIVPAMSTLSFSSRCLVHYSDGSFKRYTNHQRYQT